MKAIYLVALMALCVMTIASAQTNFLKNGGFETWNNNLPANWSADPSYATKSTIAHGGSFALRLSDYLLMGVIAYPGQITQSATVSGSSFTLKGWYQLKSDSGDGISFSMIATKGTAYVGAGADEFYQVHSAYTAFSIGVSMYPDHTADSCWVSIMMAPDTSSGAYHLTSYALFDDLVLDNTITGVSGEEFAHPLSYQLLQNYPNPFNPATEIEFTIAQEQHVTLKVYNVVGQEVVTLVDDQLPQGRYKKSFDASQVASGMYLYELRAGTFSQVKKMIVVK